MNPEQNNLPEEPETTSVPEQPAPQQPLVIPPTPEEGDVSPVVEQPAAPQEFGVPAPDSTPVSEQASTPNPFGETPVSSEQASAAETPVVPVAPVAPIGSSPETPQVTKAPHDPKKKKLLIMIAAIVGGVILLAVAAFVVLSFLSPSKADYRAAAIQYNVAAKAYSDMSRSASALGSAVSSSTTETKFKNDSESLKEALTAFNAESEKLANMKALKTGEGKELLAAYNEKVTAFTKNSEGLLVSLDSFRPAALACKDTTTAVLLDECIAKLSTVGDIPDADLKQYAGELNTQYKALKEVTTKLNAIPDSERYNKQYDAYKELRDQERDVQSKIRSAASDFRSNATKHANDIDPSKAANELGLFLGKKSNQ